MMRRLLIRLAIVALLSVALEPAAGADAVPAGRKDFAASFACTEKGIASYEARRAAGPIKIDGLLDEPSWQKAEKSPRFVDMVTGEPGWYDTRVAVMWDDENLYVGYWIEQPYVEAHLTEQHGAHGVALPGVGCSQTEAAYPPLGRANLVSTCCPSISRFAVAA